MISNKDIQINKNITKNIFDSNNWKIISSERIQYFQSKILRKYNFNHAFFTINCKGSNPEELQSEIKWDSEIYYLKQIHSNKVIEILDKSNDRISKGDALITKEYDKSLWLYTADCIPILIADTKTRTIGVCHTGLKGLQNNILSEIIIKLEEIGCKKKNLIIAMGPAINRNNYQVESKDIAYLLTEITDRKILEYPSYLYKSQVKDLIPQLKIDINPKKLFFDIQIAATLQLIYAGLIKEQIHINRLCTFSNPKLFNSWRRNHSLSRQWSCIYS